LLHEYKVQICTNLKQIENFITLFNYCNPILIIQAILISLKIQETFYTLHSLSNLHVTIIINKLYLTFHYAHSLRMTLVAYQIGNKDTNDCLAHAKSLLPFG